MIVNSNLVFFLGDTSIESRLVLKELQNYQAFEVVHKPTNELRLISDLDGASVVIMDYKYTEQQQFKDLLMTETMSFDLIVYNVPGTSESEQLVEWKRLKGLMYSDAPTDHLGRSVEAVLNGEMWIPRHCMEKMLNHYRNFSYRDNNPFDELTRREKQILDRLVCGRSNQEIADELFVAESTVKTHIYKLYKKMNVHNRNEAIRCFKRAQERNESF